MDPSELQAMKAELQRMQNRIDELEQAERSAPVSRRNMLRGLGAAAAGAAVGGLAFAHPAAAANGGNIVIGDATNNGTAPTWLVANTGFSGSTIMTVTNDDAAPSPLSNSSFYAYANADATNVGSQWTALYGRADTGDPATVNAIAGKLDGPTPLKLIDSTGVGAPTSARGGVGRFQVESGNLWYCVSGSPFDMVPNYGWRKLTGPGAAGAYHAVTPTRVYDSRPSKGGAGAISSGQHRDVSVANAISTSTGAVVTADFIPPNTKAIMANVTVTGTVAAGYLACNPGGNYTVTASTINWTATGQTIANGVTLTISSDRKLALIVNGGGSSTQVIVDVMGYYL